MTQNNSPLIIDACQLKTMPSKTQDFFTITKRRLQFDYPDQPAISWYPKRQGAEIFLDNLSCYLPVGEAFFIESVRHYLPRLSDDKLKREVALFIAQETLHSGSYKEANAHFRCKNHSAIFSEFTVEMILFVSEHLSSKRFQLAATCAMEHFTASLSHALLAKLEVFQEYSTTPHKHLWIWHAIEEVEHKSVAFDVYEEVTSNKYWRYLMRIFAMIIVSLLLSLVLAINLPFLILGKRKKFGQPAKPSAISIPASHHFIAVPSQKKEQNLDKSNKKQGVIKAIVVLANDIKSAYLSFYRPSFHPWDINDYALVEKVKSYLIQNTPG